MNNPPIIVPVDWTERSLRALTPARVLAGQLGYEVQVLSIIPTDEPEDERRAELEQEVGQRGIPDAQISVFRDTSTMEGVRGADRRLLEVIESTPSALVCMSTHARRAAAEIVLGSVASDVLRNSGRPVILVGPRFSADWTGPLNSIVVCLDGSAMSEEMIGPAAQLATVADAELSLIQVLPPSAVHDVVRPDASKTAYVERLAAKVAEQHELSPKWEVLRGDNPARAITEYATTLPGAMLAMTTHGRSGLSRLILGSVARAVVHDAHCPVMALHPRDGAGGDRR